MGGGEAQKNLVLQVKVKCVNCDGTRWLNPGERPICERDYGPMYVVAARVAAQAKGE